MRTVAVALTAVNAALRRAAARTPAAPRWLAAAGLAAAVGLSGCTLAFKFDECQKDADCPTAAGKRQFCTSDRLCAVGTPVERLCAQSYPASPAPDAVRIGAILTLPTDNLSLQALQLGIDEINGLSGAGQRPLSLHVCDAAGTEDDALKAMKHLARNVGVVGVVGPTSSSDVLAVAAEAGASQVPLVSPSATTPSISSLPQRGFIFRVAPSDEEQGRVLASLVSKQAGDKLALLFVRDTYGNGLQAPFLTEWMRLTGKMPVTINSFEEQSDGEVGAAAQAALAAAPTDVVLITYLDSPSLLTRLQGLPMTTRLWMTDGAKTSDVLALLGAAPPPPATYLARVRGTAPTVGTGAQAYVGFQSAFKAKFGVDPSSDAFSAYSYDALYAIAIAIANGKGAPTGALVSQGLRRISGSDALTRVGQSAYLEAVRRMAAGMAVPLDGATGEIRFTDTGDRQKVLFEQWAIDVAGKRFTSTPAM